MDASLSFCVSSGLLPPDTPHVIQHGMGQLLGDLARQPQHSILAQARAAAGGGGSGGSGGEGQQQGEQGEEGLGGGGGGSATARAVAAVEGIIGYRFRYPVLCAQVRGSGGPGVLSRLAYPAQVYSKPMQTSSLCELYKVLALPVRLQTLLRSFHTVQAVQHMPKMWDKAVDPAPQPHFCWAVANLTCPTHTPRRR